MQVRARTSPGVHEPLGTDRAHLDPVVQPVADGWLQRQRIGAERVEPETQRSRRAQGNAQVLRVLTLQVIESVDRRRVYLDQTQHELGGEAHRTGRFLAAALQELVGPLRWMPGVLEQEEFLLEPGPSIQQTVAFTHPVPEHLDVFSIFCGENATPDVGSRLWPRGGNPGSEESRSLQHVIFGVDEKEVRDLATAQRAPRATGAWRDRDQGAPRERADAALVGEDGGKPDLHKAGRRAATALVDASMKVGSTSASELFGLALALLGALITLVIGTTQFLNNRRRISTGEFVPSVAAYLIIVAGSLAFAGAFVIYVLIT